MQAVKVFNNNAVSVIMPDGREAILVGNGLGFGRRPGDVIDKSRVSKVYYVQNELQTFVLRVIRQSLEWTFSPSMPYTTWQPARSSRRDLRWSCPGGGPELQE